MTDRSARLHEDRAPLGQRRDEFRLLASSLAGNLGTQLREILDGLSDGFVAVDDAWRFTHVNPAAERLLHRTRDSLLGEPMWDALRLGPDNPFRLNYLTSKASGDPTAFTAYSEIFATWVEVRGYPHRGGYAMLFRDVTAERRAYLAPFDNERIQESARSINQRIFDTSQDLILVTDPQGQLVRVSPSSLSLLGYRPEELVGRSAVTFIVREDLETTRNEMRVARRGRTARQFDCRYVHKDGHVVPLTWTGVWSEPDQQHFFIGRDMTERIAAEQRLHRAQRLEAVGQLTGGIAHDFNNLLAVVIGNIELMFDRPDLDADVAAQGRAALHAAQRGAELVRGLLAFARQQPLKPKIVDANELVGNVTRLLDRTLGQHINVTFTGGSGLWPIVIDPANLESAIANLAVNARDAMPGGGRLTIETRNMTLDEEYARSNPGAVPGEYVAVTVSDTGTGMAPEVLNRIFEPFFTTKEPGMGTGLGLSMVFGFVKQSGGHIKAYSEVGHGTSMRLYLPRAKSDDLTQQSSPVEQPAQSGRQERILVVEDNDGIRQLVLMQLAKLGYEALEADGAAAALEVLDRGEQVDLLFTDIVMPGGVSGHVLAREALERRPDLKVLYTSGFPSAQLVGVDGITSADVVLSKPYRLADLARKLRDVLGS